MTHEQFGKFVVEIYSQEPPKHLRRGQWAYNLYVSRYKEMPRPTGDYDPFYIDDNLGNFFKFISQHVSEK